MRTRGPAGRLSATCGTSYTLQMDPLSILLNGVKVRTGFVLQSVLRPPWSVRVQDGASLNLVVVRRGNPWLVPHTGDAVRLVAGDIVAVRGTNAFTVADDLRTPIQVVIRPGPRRTTAGGADWPETAVPGIRTWVNRVHSDCDRSADVSVLLIGKCREPGSIAAPLLHALPALLVIPASTHSQSTLISLLATEILRNSPGQDLVLERLLELLLVAVLREWFTRPNRDSAPYLGYADPVVAHALGLLHSDLGHQWTVADLAHRAGVSRATLARRFTERIGLPPMTYLTRARIDRATDLLVESDATIETIARQVGYSSAFALSSAYKRARGVSPRQRREQR